jgi:hypothetical protein
VASAFRRWPIAFLCPHSASCLLALLANFPQLPPSCAAGECSWGKLPPLAAAAERLFDSFKQKKTWQVEGDRPLDCKLMNEGSPDRPGPKAAGLDSPSPFKFPNKSAAEEQGVIKLRSQGKKAAAVAKAAEVPATERTPSAKTPVPVASPKLAAQRSPTAVRPDVHSSPSAVISEMPALPLPAVSRPKITIKKLEASSARVAVAAEVSETDSDDPDHSVKAASAATPRRPSISSPAGPSSYGRKVLVVTCPFDIFLAACVRKF